MRLLRLVNRSWYRAKDDRRRLSRCVRIFIPVPVRFRELFQPWLRRDLRVQIEPFNLGFGVLVYPEDRVLGLYPMSQRFQYLLRQLESEAGVHVYPKLHSENHVKPQK